MWYNIVIHIKLQEVLIMKKVVIAAIFLALGIFIAWLGAVIQVRMIFYTGLILAGICISSLVRNYFS